jgi:NADP-dependent 3-hydroxy acid dehydrogenase YdfG
MMSMQIKPKPVEIEKIIKTILSSREIKKTVEKIERYTGRAIYFNVDITNIEALKIVLAEAQKQFGPINAIIHGAGNLADKKIQNKDDKDFSLVFSTKIKGLENLLQLLDFKQLQYVMLFSSVAGYFGNRGQTDYAMANEVLNKFSHCFHTLYPKKHVTSINWGPWDSGMMKADLKKLYKEKGIEIIFREEGSISCVDEFLSSDKPAQVLLTKTFALPLEATLAETAHYKIKRNLSIKNNPFLNEHVIAGRPVLPATCAINWMIKNCTDIISKEYKFKWLKNFKVLKGLIFANEDTKEYITDLKISPCKEKSEDLIAHVTIYSQSESPRSLFHYSAEIGFSKKPNAPEVFSEIDLHDEYKVSQESIYSKLASKGFLLYGQSFRGVEQILNMDHRKITIKCRWLPLEQNVFGQFQVNSFNPYIADIQLHPALIYALHYLPKKCLPAEFEKIEQFKTIDPKQYFYVTLVVKSQNNVTMIFDILAHDEQGSVYQKWTGVKFILKNY